MAGRNAKIGINFIVAGIMWVPVYLRFAMFTDIWFLDGIVDPWYVTFGLLIAGLMSFHMDDDYPPKLNEPKGNK